MDDTKGSAPGSTRAQQGAKAESAKSAGKSASAGTDLQRLYVEAYQTYILSCQRAWQETQRRYQDALFKYYQDVQARATPDDVFQRFNAQRSSLQEFQDA